MRHRFNLVEKGESISGCKWSIYEEVKRSAADDFFDRCIEIYGVFPVFFMCLLTGATFAAMVIAFIDEAIILNRWGLIQ